MTTEMFFMDVFYVKDEKLIVLLQICEKDVTLQIIFYSRL